MQKVYEGVIKSVSVNEHVTVVRYRPPEEKTDEYDVYLQGELIHEGLANFEAGAIWEALQEAEKEIG